MKTKLQWLFILLTLFAIIHQAAAQISQFFRISGSAATTITAFRADGSIVWGNAQPGTNYTVQTVSSLPGGTNWVDYVQLPVTNGVNTNRLIDFNPPAGMSFIPAGVFTMGNSIGDSDITNANPMNIYVSAFYMDANLVSLSQWQSVYNWATNNGYGFIHAGDGRAANHPAVSVDWYDCGAMPGRNKQV
jgi:formylglycine-generating enzyme required for sulfatase activity